jgi:cytochrome c553
MFNRAAIPKIAGQNQKYLVNALQAYKSGRHETQFAGRAALRPVMTTALSGYLATAITA